MNEQIQLDHLETRTPSPKKEVLYKHVNAVALMPSKGGRRITIVGRRIFNILIHRAQSEGPKHEYSAQLHELTGDVDFNSKNTAHFKKVFLELLTTTVEWQSPSDSDVSSWDACNLLSGAGISTDKKTRTTLVRWRFDSQIKEKLLSPDRYARLSIEAITQLTNHASLALYEICARYVDNPSYKTLRRPWRWWKPVLSGTAKSEVDMSEYKFFKRDVLKMAVKEINALTNLNVVGPIEFKEKDNHTISDLQFEVRLKSNSGITEKPLVQILKEDLHLIGLAISLGIKQADIENLLRKYGSTLVGEGLGELQNRLSIPVEKIGPLTKPLSWLKTVLTKMSKAIVEDAVIKKSDDSVAGVVEQKQAWRDEWMLDRRTRLMAGFHESTSTVQSEIYQNFKGHLINEKQPQILKKFLAVGWDHRMVREIFVQFVGQAMIGKDWDKPSADELLTIAAGKSR